MNWTRCLSSSPDPLKRCPGLPPSARCLSYGQLADLSFRYTETGWPPALSRSMEILENNFCCVMIEAEEASTGGTLKLFLRWHSFGPRALLKQDSVCQENQSDRLGREMFSRGQSRSIWAKEIDELYNKPLFNLLSSGFLPMGMWVHCKFSYSSYLFSVLSKVISLNLPYRGYLTLTPLSTILWSGVWTLSFWWFVSKISDTMFQLCPSLPWEMGGGEGHCTTERALGIYLLPS